MLLGVKFELVGTYTIGKNEKKVIEVVGKGISKHLVSWGVW